MPLTNEANNSEKVRDAVVCLLLGGSTPAAMR
jgi:hypothetical protein